MTALTHAPDKDLCPLFSVSGIVLMPTTLLPLRIFEPHYVEMLHYALANNRRVGVVQPRANPDNLVQPPLYEVGCIGRITTFAEAEDDQYLITLTGVQRFRIVKEQLRPEGFRCATITTDAFKMDLETEETPATFDRKHLVESLRLYCELHGIGADWEFVQNLPLHELTASLALICPFSPSEKQALLESPTGLDRAQTLAALLEMACLRQNETHSPRH